jgi:hypothetical protein
MASAFHQLTLFISGINQALPKLQAVCSRLLKPAGIPAKTSEILQNPAAREAGTWGVLPGQSGSRRAKPASRNGAHVVGRFSNMTLPLCSESVMGP